MTHHIVAPGEPFDFGTFRLGDTFERDGEKITENLVINHGYAVAHDSAVVVYKKVFGEESRIFFSEEEIEALYCFIKY